MPDIHPFQALHFDWRRVPLSREICPPYDVISADMDRRLRRMPQNTIHIELPSGGPDTKYENARKTWAGWNEEGLVVKDPAPGFYVIRQQFRLKGKTYRRVGFLGGLSLAPESLKSIIPHEKTLAKPKEDRLNLIRAVKVNTSPIFAIYPDAGGALRRRLSRITRGKPVSSGRALDGVQVTIWRMSDLADVLFFKKTLKPKIMMIADGHHRLEVAKEYYRSVRDAGGGSSGARAVLCYFCAQEDPGLIVLPTHRVLSHGNGVMESVSEKCALSVAGSLKQLEGRVAVHPSPFAFGLLRIEGGKKRFFLAVPSGKNLNREIPTKLGVEWLAKKLFSGVDPHLIRYTHESAEASDWLDSGGAAFLVKPIPVKNIREAAVRVGLLPQKSTYFYPKVQAGLVFKEA